jgi:hypothetical protein
VQEQADRSFNYLSQYRFAEDRFVQLVADSMRTVTVTPGDKYAYGVDNSAYQQEASYSGRNYMDVYRVDLSTGKSTLQMKKKPAVGPMMSSPDGRKVLYWRRSLRVLDSPPATRQHHAGGDVLRQHGATQQPLSADPAARLGEGQFGGPALRQLGCVEGAGESA